MGKACRFLLLIIFCNISAGVSAQVDSVAERIILIGDAGKFDANNKHPELELIKKVFDLNKVPTTVIFLGDNIYPQGLPSAYASNYLEKKAVLDSQINLVRGTTAKAYFIAGNHDWMQGRPEGWQQVINQYRYITGLQLENVQYVPSAVCPGPEEIALSDKVTLVVIDSQWWLHSYDKPGLTSGCEFSNPSELLEGLKDIVYRNRNKILLFAAHHPFITYGRHGGFFTIQHHIFPLIELNPKLYIPLPIIGSIYPISRGVFGNIQDTRHPTYKNFSSAVDSILNMHPYCIRVAGHEHNLQHIVVNNNNYIVSGAGAKISSMGSKKPGLKYGTDRTGFGVIERIRNGNVHMQFYSSMNDTVTIPIYSETLLSVDTTPVKPKPYTIPKLPEYVTVSGNENYTANKFKRWLLGDNYRNEWGTPVRVQVFDIGKEYGGLTPTRRGGGMQTKSLQLVDKNKQEFVLRSIEKFPDNAIPEEFRETFIKDLVVDGISASYPYAALSVPVMSEASGVPHAKPRLVYVPDDPRFGFYQDDFKNSLAIFEEREPGRYGNSIGTEKLLEHLLEDNDDRVRQQSLLKARLLDFFIMDFDRHEDQWRWASIDTGKGKVYFPIPRDRDQAFFVNQGIIPRQVRKPWFLPSIQGFRAEAHNIITFNHNARLFDRIFLNQVTRQQWSDSINVFLSQMTDSVIERAIRQQPPEIFSYSGPQIIETLKRRRNYLKKEAMQYYKYLAREVEITGSDKKEFFDVVRNDNGSVHVTVQKIDKDGNLAGNIYHRLLSGSETKEVQLFGMGGVDSFRITGKNAGNIKVRMIGGAGDDIYENLTNTNRKNVIYDLQSEENIYRGNFRMELSNDPGVNQPNRNRRNIRYNYLRPMVALTFNRDDGVFVGGTLKYRRQGFRKYPFEVEHVLTGTHALATRAYQFRYSLERIKLYRNNDFLLNAELKAPNYTLNFFGFGNESEYNKENNIRFYRTRFDQGDGSIMLRNRIAEFVTLAAGPAFSYALVDRDENIDRIVYHPSSVNLDSASLYKDKSYLGAQAVLTVDNRNDTIIPSRGVLWVTSYRNFGGLGEFSNNYSQLNTDMSIYISTNQPARFVFVVRFGAGWTYGRYEFFQAQSLSGVDNLRGYRKNRFSGHKMLYNNLEVRWRVKDFRSYLFPGAFGLLAFHDIGRVYLKGENSSRWHNGYGGGIWISPAGRTLFSASVAFSKEGVMPLLSVGFHF